MSNGHPKKCIAAREPLDDCEKCRFLKLCNPGKKYVKAKRTVNRVNDAIRLYEASRDMGEVKTFLRRSSERVLFCVLIAGTTDVLDIYVLYNQLFPTRQVTETDLDVVRRFINSGGITHKAVKRVLTSLKKLGIIK